MQQQEAVNRSAGVDAQQQNEDAVAYPGTTEAHPVSTLGQLPAGSMDTEGDRAQFMAEPKLSGLQHTQQQEAEIDIPQPDHGGGSAASSPISAHIHRQQEQQKQQRDTEPTSPIGVAGQIGTASSSSSPAATPSASPSSNLGRHQHLTQPAAQPVQRSTDNDGKDSPTNRPAVCGGSSRTDSPAVYGSSSPAGANELQSPSSVFLPAPSVTGSLHYHSAAVLGSTSQADAAVRAAPASPPPGRPTYSALQLRCQALEVALEQQTQRTDAAQTALAAAHAQHAAEEASIRQYYEAQLSDRQHELSLLMQHMAAAAACAESAAAAADGGGSTVVIGAEESMGFTSMEVHPSPLGPQQQRQQQQPAGRPLSPTVAAVAAGAGLRGPGSSNASSSVSLTDVALLRRELGQAEGLIAAYQAENKAAAKRIKELESQLSSARAELADEAGRAQRAAAAAAEVQRASGAAAAERLQRQLQLEGQIEQMQSSWQEREQQLMAQIEALRRDKAAAAAQAAAAAEGHDMTLWQADDALVAELRGQLADQAAAHAAQLQTLQDKLNWYAENQVLLGSADHLVAQQAELISQLESRLMEAEGAAGRGQAARIAELEEQVVALQAALASRHPSSLPALLAASKFGPGEAAALAQAAATIRQLESQLEQQQQQHEHGLRQLQQQYEALKTRLEQRHVAQQAAAGVGPAGKARVRELTQQLEEQRAMYTRRIRTLEAKLTAAEGAAVAASRRASSSSTGGMRTAGTKAGDLKRATAQAAASTGLRRSNQGGRAAATSADIESSDAELHEEKDTHPDAAAPADEYDSSTITDSGAQQAAAAGAGDAGSRAVVSGLLRVKERQLAGLVAQLEERTSQFLQLQQKHRAAEKQLKALTAQQQHHHHQQQQQGDGGSSSSSPAGAAGTRSQHGPAAAAPPPGVSDTTAAVPDASQYKGQGQQPTAPDVGRLLPQRRHRASTSGGDMGGAGTAAAAAASSWPALCAELELENEQLKVALAEARRAADESQQQLTAITAGLGKVPQHQDGRAAAPAEVAGLPSLSQAVLPPANYLLSVVEETAAREAARWETQVTALQELLHQSQAEAAGLSQELALCKAKGGAWTPSVAAFEALERKINALEAAAEAQRQQAQLQQQQQQMAQGLLAGLGADPVVATAVGGVGGFQAVVGEVVAALSQRYEAALAAKTSELEGFRVQLDALLEAARKLQEKRQAAAADSRS